MADECDKHRSEGWRAKRASPRKSFRALACEGRQSSGVALRLRPKRAIRNPLLELRPWIFDLIFGDFGGPFWLVFTSWKLSGARISILEGLTELPAGRESSGARLGPIFRSFSPEV